MQRILSEKTSHDNQFHFDAQVQEAIDFENVMF